MAIGVANSASAGLTMDLRLPDAPDGKRLALTPADVGRKFGIELYAVVTGTDDAATAGEGFSGAGGSIISNRVPAGGGFGGRLAPAGDLNVDESHVTVGVTPFNAAGANRGASRDLNNDGVTDLGAVPEGDVVIVRASNTIRGGEWTTEIPDGREYKVGRVEFEVTDAALAGDTEFNWVYRRNAQGGPIMESPRFVVDGVNVDGLTGEYTTGAPVVFSVVPEPATAGVVAAGMLGLLTCRRRR